MTAQTLVTLITVNSVKPRGVGNNRNPSYMCYIYIYIFSNTSYLCVTDNTRKHHR